ncbi:MAG: TlpA family protein disulfide reductase [Candidatus Kapaibacterium sp.]
MKKYSPILIAIIALAVTFGSASAQQTSNIPSENVKDLFGKTLDTKTFENDGKPFVINFWATWCKPCILELNNISDVYAKWQHETGVKVIAISIDDSRNSKKVAPFVRGRGWEFEVYLDDNQDFKRAMNVNNPPHTFLFDGDGNLVMEHNSYAPGDEIELYNKIKEISQKQNNSSENEENEE